MFLDNFNFALLVLAAGLLSASGYTALGFLGRGYQGETAVRKWWTSCGALLMACGLWSTDYLVVLSARLPFESHIDVRTAFLVWLVSLAASSVSYFAVSRPVLRWRLLLGGAAIATVATLWGCHLTLGSLRIVPSVHHQPLQDAIFLVDTFAVILGTLGVAYWLRDSESWRGFTARFALSILAGTALTSCEYAEFSSVVIPHDAVSTAATRLNVVWLTPLIAGVMSAILVLGVVAAYLDRRLKSQRRALLASLYDSKARLEYNNRHDALTKLPNREAIYAHIDTLTRRGGRTHRSALISIDLDNFNLINKNLGHLAGDRLLKRSSDAIRSVLDHRHMLGRFVADEFFILQDGVTSEDEVEALAESVNAALTEIREQGVVLTASIGIAIFPDDGADVVSLMSAADMAMSEAKRSGKNRAQRYLPRMGSVQLESFQLQKELRRGIQNNELAVFYQPKFAAADLALSGAEALVHWNHPKRGVIPPTVFIEIAERSALIRDLELKVIEIVCQQIRQWRDDGYAVLPISVNLSVARLMDERLVPELEDVLARFRLMPSDLILEITETLAMQEFAVAERVLRQLSMLGVQISLDDFGTGYSSLSYLQALPIQQLKIDRTFIANLGAPNSRYNEIVKLIINLAHVLDISVVAEGIETVEQQRSLRDMGCNELQGFFLGRPMPAAQLEQRLGRSGSDTHGAASDN